MATIASRFRDALNVFTRTETEVEPFAPSFGVSYGSRPDRYRPRVTNEKSIVTSIYNRIAIDVAAVDIRHVQLDKTGRYQEDRKSGLTECLQVEANLDQTPQELIQNAVMVALDEGAAAIVPIDTTLNPEDSGSWDVRTMRVGRIVGWYPQHIRVSLWNEKLGKLQEIPVSKRTAAIVVNPMYHVMNEPNSTLQRLIRKLNLLDAADEVAGSGKLDMIIQLPYVIKSEARRQQAEQRRKDIEVQLRDGQYGIAYTDGTERITQLNRPAENNLLKQIEYLTEMVYGQLGITAGVMNGTANEAEMLNYFNRTVKPLLEAFKAEFLRKFITKTGRTQGQSVMYFRDPFSLVPLAQLAEIADKLTRNEILTSNEVRSYIGVPPSTDPKADKLQNSNVPAPSEPGEPTPPPTTEGDNPNEG